MIDSALPMFPLGTVIFPFTMVPLRVFEPRYQALVDRCLDDKNGFGSVLIERGTEVGGGDQRFEVGTWLRLTDVSDLPDGHRLIFVAGVGRLRVERWLTDDPFPRADVLQHPDSSDGVGMEQVERVASCLRTFLALASELGADVAQIKTDLADDPVAASYQLAALTPVTPLDSYRMLVATGASDRLRLAEGFLQDRCEVMRKELGGQL